MFFSVRVSEPDSDGLLETRRVPRRLGRLVCSLLLGSLTLSGCGKPDAPAPEMPPPSVVVVPAQSRVVDEEASFVGRVLAVNRVDLRARVEGFLEERRFTEGQAATSSS